VSNDHWDERKRDRGPERMVSGPARDTLIDLFAELYPEPEGPADAFEIADAVRLAREPGSPRPLQARVTDAFFGRKRTGRTR
jgi:hypothetical protein